MEHHEEDYFRDSKEGKRERKRKTTQDRSKFKKSNEGMLKQRSAIYAKKRGGEKTLRGRVLAITGLEASVDFDGTLYTCVLRGVFKRDRVKVKNLLTVGDLVHFEVTSPQEGVIVEVEERYSVLSRADNLSRNKEHILAANIDQIFVTVSVGLPALKPSIIDRYVIAARKGNMQPVILINKIDLLEKGSSEAELFEAVCASFEKMEISLLAVSVHTGEGIDVLKGMLMGKASVFAGQSGVGKSSLINAVTGLNLDTAPPVEKTGKGSHTTTRAQLIPLEKGGWCIDTPGIKSFGVWGLEPEEIEGYFVDFQEYGHLCHYPRCTHLHEPGCAVKDKVSAGEIPFFRYESYCLLFGSASEEHRKR